MPLQQHARLDDAAAQKRGGLDAAVPKERTRLDPAVRKKITTLLRQFYRQLGGQKVPARIADLVDGA